MSETDKTIGEQIEGWKAAYNRADKVGKWAMRQIAAAEHFKAKMIWEFVKQQPTITKEEAFKDK